MPGDVLSSNYQEMTAPSLRLLAILLLGAVGSTRLPAASLEELKLKDAAATVVVYNTADPGAKELAGFYCEARHIDPARQIGLTTSLAEEISRPDYKNTIEGPLLEEFVKRGYWQFLRSSSGKIRLASTQIGYVVLIKGMPLKIAHFTPPPSVTSSVTSESSPPNPATSSSRVVPSSPASPATPSTPAPPTPPAYATCNSASVDSELSVMGCFQHAIPGLLGNPYCITNEKGAKTQIPPGYLMVARLDGPTAESVRSMVLDGIRAEKEGLWGWGVIDLRSITQGTYKLGDDWIRIAGLAMRRSGIPVLSDDLPETLSEGYPLNDVSAYYGWYSGSIDGPFSDPGFRFQPGAVAFHLHSFSASTLRDTQSGWTGPLIMHGAAASLGNVYEPYLGFTTNLGTLARVLLAGHNLAESYYAAQPVLSWMSVLVGDPLYRPYARFMVDNLPSSKWSDYRRIILAHKGSVLDAATDLNRRAREKHESLYLEALGAAQYDMGQLEKSEASFKEAATLTKDPEVSLRLTLEQVRAIEKLGKQGKQGERGSRMKAISLLSKKLEKDGTIAQKKLLLNWMHRIDPMNFPAG